MFGSRGAIQLILDNAEAGAEQGFRDSPYMANRLGIAQVTLPYFSYNNTVYETDNATIPITAGANSPRKFKIINEIGGTNPELTLTKNTANTGDISEVTSSILGTAAFVEPVTENNEQVNVTYDAVLKTDEGTLNAVFDITLSKEWLAKHSQYEPQPQTCLLYTSPSPRD